MNNKEVMRVMMKNKEEIERECDRRCVQYVEELRKHEELVSQFVSISRVEPGKSIPSPKRTFDMVAYKEIQESEQQLDDARKRWNEALDQLYEAYH